MGNPGFFAVARALFKDGGLSAFYRGIAISLILAINPAIMNTLITSFLQVVASFKRSFLEMDDWESREHSPAAVGFVTGLSKCISTVMSYPLIRIKVLQQTGTVSSQMGFVTIFQHILVTALLSVLLLGRKLS